MPELSRRSFLAWMASAVATTGLPAKTIVMPSQTVRLPHDHIRIVSFFFGLIEDEEQTKQRNRKPVNVAIERWLPCSGGNGIMTEIAFDINPQFSLAWEHIDGGLLVPRGHKIVPRIQDPHGEIRSAHGWIGFMDARDNYRTICWTHDMPRLAIENGIKLEHRPSRMLALDGKRLEEYQKGATDVSERRD
jgi:hypothetical protein